MAKIDWEKLDALDADLADPGYDPRTYLNREVDVWLPLTQGVDVETREALIGRYKPKSESKNCWTYLLAGTILLALDQLSKFDEIRFLLGAMEWAHGKNFDVDSDALPDPAKRFRRIRRSLAAGGVSADVLDDCINTTSFHWETQNTTPDEPYYLFGRCKETYWHSGIQVIGENLDPRQDRLLQYLTTMPDVTRLVDVTTGEKADVSFFERREFAKSMMNYRQSKFIYRLRRKFAS